MQAAVVIHLPALALALSVSTAAAMETTSRTLPLAFNKCLGIIRYTGVQTGVPPVNIVKTHSMRMARFDTEGGSVLITCSRADQKIVITRIIFD
jgi:hypothetical protein